MQELLKQIQELEEGQVPGGKDWRIKGKKFASRERH